MSRIAVVASPLLLAAVVSLTLGLGGCSQGGASDKVDSRVPPSRYSTIANGKVDVEGGIVEVAARRPGIIKEVVVQEGDVVRKGQVLARQEDDDSRLAVGSAKAALAQSDSQLALTQLNIATTRRELERLQNLVASNLVPKQQLDQARDAVATAQAQLEVQQANVRTARAQVAQAEYSEDLTIIRAPMDGKIIRRYANPGAGASTLNVSDMFDLEPASPHIVRAEIVESALSSVYVGQVAEIIPEADPAKIATGRVLRIAATFGLRKLKSDRGNEATDERVVEVVVSADGTPFLIGQRVLIKFLKRGETGQPRQS